jgi:hypothetical protein
MAQAAFPLLPPLSEAQRISPTRPASPDALPRCVEAVPCRESRDGTMPSAVPASHALQSPNDPPKSSAVAARAISKKQKLQALQAEIDRIERSQAASFVSSAAFRARPFNPSWGPQKDTGGVPCSDGALWLSGEAYADQQLQPGGLDRETTHEIKPAIPSVASQPAVLAAASAEALGFALQLAARCVSRPARPAAAKTILFCATLDIMREVGRLYGPGLRELGVAPQQLLIVEASKPAEILWAMEEGLKSQALGAVIGCLREVTLTPARRLSLAAKAYATPCLFVTDARSPSAGATASRWRIGRDAGAGGQLEVVLEKLRVRAARWTAPEEVTGCSFKRSA